MKKDINQPEDKYLKDLFKKGVMKEASEGFTSRLMNRVELEVIEKPIAYKPPVSKKGWLLIFLSAFGLVLLGMFTMEPGNPYVDTQNYAEAFTSFLGGLSVSPVLIYGVIGFWVLFFMRTLLEKLITGKLSVSR